jgi:Spy/CpxP family protein refolding chaperone
VSNPGDELSRDLSHSRAAGAPRRGLAAAALVLLTVALSGMAIGVALDRTVLSAPRREGGGRQDGGQRGASRGNERRHAERDRFAKTLNLTNEQRAMFDTVMGRQMRELREARESIRPRMDSLLLETRHQIDEILTPEQRLKLDSMRARGNYGRMRNGQPPLSDSAGALPPRPR